MIGVGDGGRVGGGFCVTLSWGMQDLSSMPFVAVESLTSYIYSLSQQMSLRKRRKKFFLPYKGQNAEWLRQMRRSPCVLQTNSAEAGERRDFDSQCLQNPFSKLSELSLGR